MGRKKFKILGSFFFCLGIFSLLLFKVKIIHHNKTIDRDIQHIYENRDSYQVFPDNLWIAILEIPSLNIKNYLYDVNSIFNNVNQNVYVVPDSTMPTYNYSNLILAGHSGYGSSAYFRNLDRLNLNDSAIVYYQNQIYRYRYVSFYQEKKDGTIVIHREKGKKNLMLITCDPKNRAMQSIYVFEMIH